MQLPKPAEGGGWVISDNLPVFFKNGKRKNKKTKHLRKSSLEQVAYSKKIAAFGVLVDWKAAIFFVTCREIHGDTFATTDR